jgi:hypothetical protein
MLYSRAHECFRQPQRRGVDDVQALPLKLRVRLNLNPEQHVHTLLLHQRRSNLRATDAASVQPESAKYRIKSKLKAACAT